MPNDFKSWDRRPIGLEVKVAKFPPRFFDRGGQILPYKDPEKRRSFHREYQRRRRAKEGLTNPCRPLMSKAYICLKIPHLRLPGIVFTGGLFVTDQPYEQAVIEQDPMYGNGIFSWVVQP